MRLYNLILNQYLKGGKLFTLIALFVFGYTLNAQDSPQESAYIDNKLQQIDSLIDVGQYDKAGKLITNTLNTFSFKKNAHPVVSKKVIIANYKTYCLNFPYITRIKLVIK